MFEITVQVDAEYAHTKIKVKDAETDQCYIVSLGRKQRTVGTINPHAISLFDNPAATSSTCGEVTIIKLYSHIDKSFDDFVQDIESEFKYFQICCSNCADAANYTLNYFFPREKNCGIETAWQTYKCLTAPCAIATLCIFVPYFGMPLIHTPADIVRKAKLLARYYSDVPEVGAVEVSASQGQQKSSLKAPLIQSMT